jgi:hypothetical protein
MPAIPPLAGRWLASIRHRIVDQSNTPFLDRDGAQVRQQGKLKPHGVRGQTVGEAFITIPGNDVGRDRGKAVLTQCSNQRLRLLPLRRRGRGFLRDREFRTYCPSASRSSKRSAFARWMNTPRTISSSVRRAQSVASRLVPNVLMTFGHPRLRTMAFQVDEGFFVIDATARFAAQVFRKRSESVPGDQGTGQAQNTST